MSIVWRLASGRYRQLDGEGARLAGGRWNSSGQAAIYTSECLGLCLAEALVHLPGALPRDYVAFKVDVPDEAIGTIEGSSLKGGWEQDWAYTRALGDEWLSGKRSLALKVPSAVLPESINLVLNPLHLRANELRVIWQQQFKFDPRLRP